jgi:hypothetical protein
MADETAAENVNLGQISYEDLADVIQIRTGAFGSLFKADVSF